MSDPTRQKASSMNAKRYPHDGAQVTDDFFADAAHEAKYQTERWGDDHDARKSDAEWFWLLGWLLGKAMRPDASYRKRRHRLRAAAGALKKWDDHLAYVFDPDSHWPESHEGQHHE